MEFHVEKENDSKFTHLVMNKLLFKESLDGILPDLKNQGTDYSFVWIKFEKLVPISLNSNIKLASLQAGMKIGWLDKSNKQFQVIRICSHTEYYDQKTLNCKPCFVKNDKYP